MAAARKTRPQESKPEADRDANRDPITGTPGAHPVGTGIGAAGGGVAGAAIGGVTGGPVGAAIGAAIGGLAGGLVGKGAGEAVNPTEEDLAHWRERHPDQPYADESISYEEYEPAYMYGYVACIHCSPHGRSFEEVEPELERRWGEARGSSSLDWPKARGAVRQGWSRVERGGSGETVGRQAPTTSTTASSTASRPGDHRTRS